MKKLIATIGVTVMTVLSFTLVYKATVKANTISDNYYPMSGVVTGVKNGIITVETFDGNVWEFKDDSGNWSQDDICAMIIDNNGTDIITDDKIIKTRYIGVIC